MKLFLAFLLGVLTAVAGIGIYQYRHPLVPFTGSAYSQLARMEIYKTELAKIPAAKGVCETIKRELYVETDGKKSIWYVVCNEAPLAVSFWFNEKGEVVRVNPEGPFRDE